ncbi:hypothetical protein EVAR_92688_1 [Eumeta japonica]|uniref:Secreted protein n=1 Tax=Eumeta variegata TaxID=151549 RepID=A0A4C1T0G9_EUMVA|nr:hypothetical protein EVAR_92688_1 [Eumeta japonica]
MLSGCLLSLYWQYGSLAVASPHWAPCSRRFNGSKKFRECITNLDHIHKPEIEKGKVSITTTRPILLLGRIGINMGTRIEVAVERESVGAKDGRVRAASALAYACT